MSSDLTPETIARLRELDAARSAPPWRSAEQTHDDWTGIQDNYSALGSMLKRVDAEFIAAAANHMGTLLDAAEERDSYIDMFGVLKQAAIDMRDQRDEAQAEVTRLRAKLAIIEAERDSMAAEVNRLDADWAQEHQRAEKAAAELAEAHAKRQDEVSRRQVAESAARDALNRERDTRAELAEARAVIEQIESLAKIQAISCQAAHRADHARSWLDVLAIIERAALTPATQPEEGEG